MSASPRLDPGKMSSTSSGTTEGTAMNSAPLPRPLSGHQGRASLPTRSALARRSQSPEPAEPELRKRRGDARPPKRIRGQDRRGADRRPHSTGRRARAVPSSPTPGAPGAKEPAPQCSGLRDPRDEPRLRETLAARGPGAPRTVCGL